MLGSKLNSIFHWYAHWLIFAKSPLRSFADSFLLKNFIKGKYCQQKCYILKLICLADHLCKSKIMVFLIVVLVKLQNLFFYSDICPFKKTLCSWFWYFSRKESSWTSIPHDYNLNIRPSCQTLSNALDMSKNMPPSL